MTGSLPPRLAGRDAGRLRVAHVISSFGMAGGAETSLAKVAAGLAGRQEAAILSLTGGDRTEPDLARAAVPVVQLGLPRGRLGPGALARLVRQLARFEPDLVQGWMYHGNLAAWAAARCLAGTRPVVWNIRHTPGELGEQKRLTAWVIRYGALVSDRVAAAVFNSQASMDRHRELGYRPARLELIPNGFDCDRFRPDLEARRRVRRELGLAEGAAVVGLVARYHPIKGHPTFLAAAAMVGSNRPEASFVLAGAGTEPGNAELAGRIDALGLGGRVHRLGERCDVPALMAAFDIACLTSYGEAFPNVVGEAMATGVPCVATDVGDAARLLGEAGVVVPARNPAALAAAIGGLLDLGPEGRRRLGEAARERIVRHFGIAAMLDRYDRLYREVLGLAGGEE